MKGTDEISNAVFSYFYPYFLSNLCNASYIALCCNNFRYVNFTECLTIVSFLLQAAVSILKQEYKENETNLEGALALAIKVLSKTLDMTKLTADKCKSDLIFENN